MSILAIAMLLTGAAEGQRQRPQRAPVPPMIVTVPVPVSPMVYVPAPPPMPSPPPPRPVTPPVLLRAPQTCVPIAEDEGTYDFSECFNGGDYPLPAWRAGEQGTASVRVTLGADGRPRGCEIAVSSGSVALNRTTCDLLSRRIVRAEDVESHAVSNAVIAGDVAWVRPDGPPRDARPDLLTYFSMNDYPATALRNDEQGTTRVRIEIGTDGRPTGCVVTESSGSAALDQATCRIIRSRVRYRPARDGAGQPMLGRAYARVGWQLPQE